MCCDWLDLNLGHGARQCQPVLARISDCQTHPESQPSMPANPELPRFVDSSGALLRSPPQSPQETERIQTQVQYNSSAKNLDSPMIEGEQLNNDLAKQKKTCTTWTNSQPTLCGQKGSVAPLPAKMNIASALCF